MRNLVHFLPLSLLLGAFGLVPAGCGTSASGGTGGATGSTTTTTGSTTSSSSGGDCFDYTSFDGTTPTVSFKTDVLPIWRQSCGLSTACHGDPSVNPSTGLYLGPPMSSPAPSAAEITMILSHVVGQIALDEADMSIVKASDPAHSFMMYKLDGDANNLASGVDCSMLSCAKTSPNSCFAPMPSGGPKLPGDELDTIRRWIAQGAKDD